MRVFVLGLGSIGLRHGVNFRDLGCDVTGFDPDPERRAIAENEGIKAIDRREALLDMTAPGEAVVIASPSQAHADDLAAAVERGLHIFVEKPIAHRSEGLVECIELAERKGTVLYPALNLRHHPAVRAAKEAVRSGDIGNPLWGRFQCGSYLPDWRPHQDHRAGYAANPDGGGVILDIVHEFDLAWHLLGPYQVRAAETCNSGQLGLSTEDMAISIIRHETGAISTVHVDYLTRPTYRRSCVAGTEGWIEIDLPGRSMALTRAGGEIQSERFEGAFADDYKAEAEDFLACVAGEAEPPCSAWDAANVLEQTLRVRSASAQGSMVA